MRNSIFISFVVFLFIISCGTNKINRIHLNPTKLDTVYVLFENGVGKMNKYRGFHYSNLDPKFYNITYFFPVYWEQPNDPDVPYFPFIGDYNYSFWFGIYKAPLYPDSDFDPSIIWGNSTLLKKHKRFLSTHEIIDYEWFKQREPDEVVKALNLRRPYKERPVFFIIDKDEFEKDSIILRNAVYHGPIIE
ncbi:MAG: hypothetical protein ACYC01_14110 [Lutibacter sp.]